jgi:hypothetical protein
MNSTQIQQHVYEFVVNREDFNAPYGVLTGTHVSKKGKKYLSVTFGRSRTLDATVEIYNRNFIVLRSSRTGSAVFNDYQVLMNQLEIM